MNIEELKNKPAPELQKLLKEHREKERDLRFKISAKQMKNVRELRKIKKTIVRIITVINTKKNNPEKSNKQ